MENRFGELLRAERTRRGVSQARLGKRTGVPQPAISRIEAGLEVPSLERWARLLAGLGLKPEIELVPLAEPPSEEQHSAYARTMLSPEERLEQAAGWIKLREEIRGKARQAS
jgi:transcriptional regulator with XRE-family HTH domain